MIAQMITILHVIMNYILSYVTYEQQEFQQESSET